MYVIHCPCPLKPQFANLLVLPITNHAIRKQGEIIQKQSQLDRVDSFSAMCCGMIGSLAVNVRSYPPRLMQRLSFH